MGLYHYNLPKRKKDKAKAGLHPGMKLQQAGSQPMLEPAGEVPAPGLKVLRQAPCVKDHGACGESTAAAGFTDLHRAARTTEATVTQGWRTWVAGLPKLSCPGPEKAELSVWHFRLIHIVGTPFYQ